MARLAVLIDADNASAKIVDGLFEEIAKIGEASVRRIYGDFASACSKAWIEVLAKHAIIPQQQFAYTAGKNASDITLVIDAMDLLHSGRFDGFCLVSSDSDFTRLAARIREQGVDVFGFGEQKTPESFRQACRRFIYTENLLDVTTANGPNNSSSSLHPPSAATPIIKKVIGQMETEDGWVPLGAVGNQLAWKDLHHDLRLACEPAHASVAASEFRRRVAVRCWRSRSGYRSRRRSPVLRFGGVDQFAFVCGVDHLDIASLKEINRFLECSLLRRLASRPLNGKHNVARKERL
ncbi:NYN domain-containing protein [Rhizobium lentis]|uniref:NYN domain-containing protein n=1 Tax=Rhizobium lentis TaxID=1138194 RepID=UPI0035C89AB5